MVQNRVLPQKTSASRHRNTRLLATQQNADTVLTRGAVSPHFERSKCLPSPSLSQHTSNVRKSRYHHPLVTGLASLKIKQKCLTTTPSSCPKRSIQISRSRPISLSLLPPEMLHEVALHLPTPEHVFSLALCSSHFYQSFMRPSFWAQFFHFSFPLRISPLGLVDSLNKYKRWKAHKGTFHTSHAVVSAVNFSSDASKVVTSQLSRALYLPLRCRYSIPKEGTWEATFTFKSLHINVSKWPGVGLVTKRVMYQQDVDEGSTRPASVRDNGQEALMLSSRNLFISPSEDMVHGSTHCGLYTDDTATLAQQNLAYFSNGTLCRQGRFVLGAKPFESRDTLTLRVTPSYELPPEHQASIDKSLECVTESKEHPFIVGTPSRDLQNVIVGSQEERISGKGLVEFFVNGIIAFRCYHIVHRDEDYDSNPLIAICNVPASCAIQVTSCRYWPRALVANPMRASRRATSREPVRRARISVSLEGPGLQHMDEFEE